MRVLRSLRKGGFTVAEPFLYIVLRSQAEAEVLGGPQLLAWESG